MNLETPQNNEFIEKEEEQLALENPSYKQIDEQLTLAEQKAQEYRTNWMTSQAELENLRRRTEREIANIHKYAIEKFAKDILVTVDNLERSLVNKITNTEEFKDFYLGIELTLKSLLEILKKYEISAIDPLGEPFNPDQHTAMTTRESTNGEPQNTVLEVIQKGYMLRDRLLRPALVIVVS